MPRISRGETMLVYLLQHVHERAVGEVDVKLLGVYTSEASAQAAINRYRALPGFRASAAGFHIDAYVVDQDYWNEGFIEG